MINISVYQKGDIYKLQNMKSIYSAQTNIKSNVDELANHPGACLRTIADKSGVIAILGGSLLWAGNMEIWSVTGEGIMKHPLAYVKLARRLLSDVAIVLNIKRFQSAGLCGDPMLEKWFKAIGFVKESVMEKYGPDGKDYYMYKRII